MRTRRIAPTLGFALVLALSACDSTNQVAPAPEGWMSATIVGTGQAAYQGTGSFYSTRDRPGWPADVAAPFYIYSEGTGASAGAGFTLTGYRGDQPQVGRYPLGLSQGGRHDWDLVYAVPRGDSIEIYSAIQGEFEVTSSSEAVIGGQFNFTAVGGMVCSKDWGTRGTDQNGVPLIPCSLHTGPEPSRLEIKGSFKVVPGSPCMSSTEKTSAGGMPRPFAVYCLN